MCNYFLETPHKEYLGNLWPPFWQSELVFDVDTNISHGLTGWSIQTHHTIPPGQVRYCGNAPSGKTQWELEWLGIKSCQVWILQQETRSAKVSPLQNSVYLFLPLKLTSRSVLSLQLWSPLCKLILSAVNSKAVWKTHNTAMNLSTPSFIFPSNLLSRSRLSESAAEKNHCGEKLCVKEC